MSDGTKRTLDELITLHEIEPELSEVITEGRFDSSLLLWFLRLMGSSASVYCVLDRLDVPPGEVRRRGQNQGNKGRIIASAIKIQEKSPRTADKVTFVYDIDDDVIAGRQVVESSGLLHTDYRSLELYCFAKKPIDKMLKVRLRATEEVKANQILDTIREPLVDIAFVRLILSRLDPAVAVVESIEKKCHIDGESIILDMRGLILDSVNGAGGWRGRTATVDILMTEEQKARKEWASDSRLAIRGHDFTRLCCYYLKSKHPGLFKEDRAPYKVPEIFEATLLACLELEDLKSEELFRRLMARHCTHVTPSVDAA